VAALEGWSMTRFWPVALVLLCGLAGCAPSDDSPAEAAPVTGIITHDFGSVDIGDVPVTKTHVFELTNSTNAPIHVTDVKSTCGCTQAALSARTIPVGEAILVTVGMQFTSSGTKTAQVHLITQPDEAGHIMLTVAGQGRSLRNIRIAKTVRMKPGETRSLPILASSHIPGAAPPVFAVETPAFIHAEMRPWSQMQPLDADRGTAATWRGRLEVSVDPESNAGVHTIALNSDFGELQLVAVRVR